MFNIGDEVMDKDGKQYNVLGFKDGFYELLGQVGGVEEYQLAKYDPIIAPALAQIAEQVAKSECMLDEIKTMQTDLFEKARQKT